MVDYSRKGTIRIIYFSFILWDLLYIFGTGEASYTSVWLQKLFLTSTCQAAVWGTLSFKKCWDTLQIATFLSLERLKLNWLFHLLNKKCPSGAYGSRYSLFKVWNTLFFRTGESQYYKFGTQINCGKYVLSLAVLYSIN